MTMVIRGAPCPDVGMIGHLLTIKDFWIQNAEEFQIFLMALEFLADSQNIFVGGWLCFFCF